jgi:hypothetical protein
MSFPNSTAAIAERILGTKTHDLDYVGYEDVIQVHLSCGDYDS